MEVLGIGPLEAIFILLLALIVIGPRDLGSVARSAGRALNRVYRSPAWREVAQASRSLRGLPNRLAREAALEELDEVRRDLRGGEPPPSSPTGAPGPGRWGSLPSPPAAGPRPGIAGSEEPSGSEGPPAAASRPVSPRKPRATKLPSGRVRRKRPAASATSRARVRRKPAARSTPNSAGRGTAKRSGSATQRGPRRPGLATRPASRQSARRGRSR